LIPLLRIRTVIYSDLVGLSHLTVQLETPSGLGANDQALSPAGYEPNHDKLRYDQKCQVSTPSRKERQVSTPSRKKCGHLRRKESLEASQRVQGKPRRRRQDQTGYRRHKARQHRQDHDGGHRYCGVSRRQAIDKLGPVK